MPFGLVDWPQLGPALLKAELTRAGIECDVRHFALDYARQVGKEFCISLAEDIGPQLVQAGEWIFSPALFGSQNVDTVSYLSLVSDLAPEIFNNEFQRNLLGAQVKVEPFLTECLNSLDWSAYDVIGFSSCYQQHNASLALAKRVKESWPDCTIIFGGSNVEGKMGVELLRTFDFIDFVCLGEGDLLLPEFVQRLRTGHSMQNLSGLAFRKGGEVYVCASIPVGVQDLDSLPFPDYDDFFKQYFANFRNEGWNGRLQLEISRGCWWGERKQCAFCGISSAKVHYRSKSPQRIQDEIRFLTQRYEPRILSFVDNIVPRQFGKIVSSPEKDSPLQLFHDIRPTTSKEQLRQMKQAGTNGVLIGIETLSTSILQLMRKGSDKLTNIQVLKWCRMLGIAVAWNFLYGIPFEEPNEYRKMSDLIPSLTHLTPPGILIPILLLRFSPYYNEPERFGFNHIRPAAPYKHIFPTVPESALWNLANQFNFEYVDNRDPETYSTPIRQAVDMWREAATTSILTYIDDGRQLRLFDTRPVAQKPVRLLTGLERDIYLECDQQQTLKKLSQEHNKNDANHSLLQILKLMVEERLMVSEDNTYLSLAVDISRHIKSQIQAKISDEICLSISHALMRTRPAANQGE